MEGNLRDGDNGRVGGGGISFATSFSGDFIVNSFNDLLVSFSFVPVYRACLLTPRVAR